jgi:deoxyinosine 3'endonuclease (endonuclease V)
MNLIKETLEISKNRDYKSARALQLKLREKISFTSMRDKPKKIFGVDLAYKENRGFISIVPGFSFI